MNDSWDDRRRAQEESYFDKQNKEALARIKDGTRKPRLSPISGEAMTEVVIDGVTVDKCPKSGGIWLDAGELEEILKRASDRGGKDGEWLKTFFSGLFSNK
jgi:Zn-finger nucleic acid-binding protein